MIQLTDKDSSFFSVLWKTSRLLHIVMSPKIHKVVDAYEHAVLARYPKAR